MRVWKEGGIEPEIATVIMIVITLALAATVYIMVSGLGNLGSAPSASGGMQAKIPSYPKEIIVNANLNYHPSGVYDMDYNATYTYYLSAYKVLFISLPYKNLENLVLKVDGKKVMPDVTSYGIEIPLDAGNHTISIGYSAKDLTSLSINIPENRFIENLYIKVDVDGTNVNILDESSLKPDNVYSSKNHITYIWRKSNAVLRNDIYLKRPMAENKLDELPTVLAIFVLSGIVFVASVYLFKEKFAVDVSYVALLSPVIGPLVAMDLSFVLGVLFGAVGGIAAVIILYLRTIKNNRIVLLAGVASTFIPLYSVIPYGNLVASSAFLIFIVLIAVAYGGKFSYSEYLNNVVEEKKRIEENFRKLKEVSEKLVEEYRAENEFLQAKLKALTDENQKLLKKLSQESKGFTKNYCPNCGKEISGDFLYCPYCSAKLDILGRCPKCGNMITKDMKYCPSCGENLIS